MIMITHEEMDKICDMFEEELCENLNLGTDSPRFHMNKDYSAITYCTPWYDWYEMKLAGYRGDIENTEGFIKACIRMILCVEWCKELMSVFDIKEVD